MEVPSLLFIVISSHIYYIIFHLIDYITQPISLLSNLAFSSFV